MWAVIHPIMETSAFPCAAPPHLPQPPDTCSLLPGVEAIRAELYKLPGAWRTPLNEGLASVVASFLGLSHTPPWSH